MSTITLYEIYRIIYGKSSRNILCLHVYSYLYTRYAAGCDKGDRKPLCLNVQSYLCTKYTAQYVKEITETLHIYMCTVTSVQDIRHIMGKELLHFYMSTCSRLLLYDIKSTLCEKRYRNPSCLQVYRYLCTRPTASSVRRVTESHYIPMSTVTSIQDIQRAM